MGAVLLPLAQRDLRAPFHPRMECYDAAPGGHGRAWASFSPDLIAEDARWSDQKTPYTGLAGKGGSFGDFGPQLDEFGRCPMHRIKLPESPHWHKVGRPAGGFRHIALEMASARDWSVVCSLRRPTELGASLVEKDQSTLLSTAEAPYFDENRTFVATCICICLLGHVFTCVLLVLYVVWLRSCVQCGWCSVL